MSLHVPKQIHFQLQKAIFLDKDGTLIPDIPYNVIPEKITLHGGAVEGLQKLRDAGSVFIVVSNQSGVARGFFDEKALAGVAEKLRQLLAAAGITLLDFYFCPHHPDGSHPEYSRTCDCRKPQPGMLQKAAAEHGIDLAQSWMIGDILHDVEAGNRAGCRTVLIDNGGETEWLSGSFRTPTFTAANLSEAADLILGDLFPENTDAKQLEQL